MKIRKKILLTFFSLCFFLLAGLRPSGAKEESRANLFIFYSLNCHKCAQVKNTIMPLMEKKFSKRIISRYYDIGQMVNYKLLLSLKERHNAGFNIEVPVFYLNGNFLNGQGLEPQKIEGFIDSSLGLRASPITNLPAVDLIKYFKSFALLTVLGAGLIDGINPCAFTVIVFFISFLALQGYQRKDLISIGLSFILAVFITYVLIGLGLFGFLYELAGFRLLIKSVNLLVGLFSISLGFVGIYDFVKFKKTKNPESLVLQLPASIKNRIHKIIGMHYRLDKKHQQPLEQKKHIFKLVISALISGFLVSVLEAVCTGQTYLPTIVFVLKATQLKLQALAYLLLYNLMFIVPLLVIFIFALSGVTSGEFSNFLKRRMLLIKMLMVILFFGMGIFLLWRI